ncbi:hypothetical protein [Rugosimonospora africana]|uniref:Amidoligase enzyme n=1 Tax=Rugosimonospora africana TaxID=556532 RepID=A0A8J3QUS4_9ACTN|nr:hypothetical protein [Rugosimonospora africana]GIH16133.1 hypothetical protein Raf01_43050 [Rugosimonospora africana]
MSTIDCVDCPRDTTTQDGVLRCGDCVALTHSQCTGCDAWYPIGDGCDRCIDCDHCDRPTHPDEITTTARGDDVCRLCRGRHYWQCAECDEFNSDDDGHCANGCQSECDCEDCRADRLGDLIHEYDYKPWPVFHGTGPLFLGMELEIHTSEHRDLDDCADTALEHLGTLGYLKEDGSIGDGFEIVTHPMSYTWAMANFPWPMLDELRDIGCYTSARTGLHVHVSRDGFDCPSHTYRWMKFVYRNRSQVTRLARRESQQWAAFTDEDRRAVKHYAKGAAGNRYTAINTGNEATFELRVFASSLHADEVAAALGLAAASVEYTRHLTVPVIAHGGWTWAAFADWVDTQPQYAVLRAQMEVLACAC